VTNLEPEVTAPAIAEWTRQNQPGDTMVLTGENFSLHTGIAQGRDTRFVLYGEGTSSVDGHIQRLDGRQCALTLPTSLPPNELYLLWPCNENGYGNPVAINRAEAWWVGPNMVPRGRTFSIYGENLVADRDNPVSHVYLQGADGAGEWLTSVAANPYRADFLLPEDKAGNYKVWAHNGSGGSYGWAQPVDLTIYDELAWNDDPSTWLDVTDFGAKGDGATDDYPAIINALNQANSQEGSTVYFPSGTFLVGTTIQYQNFSGVRLLGAGKSLTTISEHPSLSSEWLMNIKFFDAEVSDMTIECGDSITSDNSLFRARSSNNLRISNVRFSQLPNAYAKKRNNIVELFDAKRIFIEDCDFIQAWVFLCGNASQVFIDRCDWYGLNDANHLVSVKNGRGFSMQNSTAQPYDLISRL